MRKVARYDLTHEQLKAALHYDPESGIWWQKREQRWRATICHPITKKYKSLGYFREKHEAIAAREKAEIELFGEFRYQKAA